MKINNTHKYKVIGLMSGTSLDGVDLACCEFNFENQKWKFKIIATQTVAYSRQWKYRLEQAPVLLSNKLLQLHTQYGLFLGTLCTRFIQKNKLKNIGLIASHGHTVFHQPKNNFTFQLGDGHALHAVCQLPVVFDFRSLDVALGGEGAPLVPVGDQLLFSTYNVCLNLGGIANLSMDVRGKRKAFDICFCNMALNHLAAKAGKDFDAQGILASRGVVNLPLLRLIEKKYWLDQNKKPSLSREVFEKNIQPLLDDDSIPLNNRLRTVCQSIANEIARAVPPKKKSKLLITGGGAFNTLLIQLIESKLPSSVTIFIPSETIINFKESLVFGLLGVLRVRGENNVLKTVTGASRNSCSGVLVGSK